MPTQHEFDKEMQTITEKRNQAFYQMVRHLLTIAAGSLAVLVSLRGDVAHSCPRHYLFVAVLSSIALGILTGGAVLYGEYATYNRLAGRMTSAVKQKKDGIQLPNRLSARPGRFFDAMTFLFFASLSLSACLLVAYAAIEK